MRWPVGAGPSGGTLTLFSCLRSRPGLPTPFAGTLINRFSCLVRGINNPDKSAAVCPPPLGPAQPVCHRCSLTSQDWPSPGLRPLIRVPLPPTSVPHWLVPWVPSRARPGTGIS